MYATTNRRLTQAPPQAECDKSHLQRVCVCTTWRTRVCASSVWMGGRPASLPGPSRASWIGSSVVHPPGQSSARGEMMMATSSASKAQIRRGQGELSRACRLTSHDDANAGGGNSRGATTKTPHFPIHRNEIIETGQQSRRKKKSHQTDLASFLSEPRVECDQQCRVQPVAGIFGCVGEWHPLPIFARYKVSSSAH